MGRNTAGGRSRRAVGSLVVATVLALAALGTSPVRAAVTAGDCTWIVKSDADRINVAYPDTNAQYWFTTFVLPPGVDVVLHGRYPLARYMSFHVYEGSVPVDGLTDVDIDPTTGTNPFLAGAKRVLGGTYDVTILPAGPAPGPGSPHPHNVLYAGQGINGEPMATWTMLYRVYLGDHDQQGSVPLPELEYRDHVTGRQVAAPVPSCEPLRSAAPSTGIDQAERSGTFPLESPIGPVNGTPTWSVAGSRPGPVAAGAPVNGGNPFFANFDNEYLKIEPFRNAGDVVVIRGRAPTFPDTSGAKKMGTGQLRYWSFCTNEAGSTRYIDCRADRDVALDAHGDYTVVVSDADHEPANLSPTDTWIPAGPYPDVFILYRHMLPDPGFTGSVQHITDTSPAGIAASMGDYYPAPTFCSTPQFEADRCGVG